MTPSSDSNPSFPHSPLGLHPSMNPSIHPDYLQLDPYQSHSGYNQGERVFQADQRQHHYHHQQQQYFYPQQHQQLGGDWLANGFNYINSTNYIINNNNYYCINAHHNKCPNLNKYNFYPFDETLADDKTWNGKSDYSFQCQNPDLRNRGTAITSNQMYPGLDINSSCQFGEKALELSYPMYHQRHPPLQHQVEDLRMIKKEIVRPNSPVPLTTYSGWYLRRYELFDLGTC